MRQQLQKTDHAVIVMEPDNIDWTTVVEATWERARELSENTQKNILELGAVLRALHDRWFRIGQGKRTDLEPSTQVASKVKNDEIMPGNIGKSYHSRPKIDSLEKGWQAKVRDELGISHDTALRLMEQARYGTMIQEIAGGRAVRYRPHKAAESIVVNPTKKRQEIAIDILRRVLTGEIKASAGWAGLIGESARFDAAGPKRNPVDHVRNLITAIRKLKNSLKVWEKLTVKERFEVEAEWEKVAPLLPETW